MLRPDELRSLDGLLEAMRRLGTLSAGDACDWYVRATGCHAAPSRNRLQLVEGRLCGHARYAWVVAGAMHLLRALGHAPSDEVVRLPKGEGHRLLARRDAPVRESRERDAPLVTQALSGEPLFGLWQDDDRWLVECSDGYVGWTAAHDVEATSQDAWTALVAGEDHEARGQRAADAARAYLDVPYLWGGCAAKGIDCSGLARAAWRAAGFDLPRDAHWQSRMGRLVATREWSAGLRAGDLLFFLNHAALAYHVAIALDETCFIHARSPGVRIDRLDALGEDDRDLAERFAFARRVTCTQKEPST